MSLIQLLRFDVKGDKRGLLVSLEEMNNVPFEIKRVYYMTGMSPQHPRGFHAHKKLKQIAICLSGSCRFILNDGSSKEEILLKSPNEGLYITEMIWREMHEFSSDCILMVLASEHYAEDDYIRDFQQFKKEVNNGQK